MPDLMPRRMLFATLAGSLLAATTLTGCVVVVGGRGHYYPAEFSSRATITETRTHSLEHLPGADLDIETRDGSIEVRRSNGSAVEIEARIRTDNESRLEAIEVSAERASDGTLRVRPVWPDGVRKRWESCAFIVHLPDAGALRLRTEDGAIRVFGVGTSIDARTEDGAIEMIDVAGPVDAETEDGAITLRQAGPGAPIRLVTEDGGVRAELDPGFRGSLDAVTDDGAISATSLDTVDAGARFQGYEPRRLRVQFGEGGPSSTIRTDDGAITITVRKD
ncbi:MAG: DUF4097 family beta strand repeat-containing protein [Phycisphaerales bacterium]